MAAPATPALHVLLVEDHLLLQRILERTLKDGGFHVTAVGSADQAIEVLQSGVRADILLSDIRMPGRLDGLQLAHWVRQHYASVIIVLQTAFTDLEVDNFRVLRKPFTPAELMQCLQDALAESRPSAPHG
ncbi:MAG: response regulator [Steroidobacteraceae bacterium]|jgi:CheY-like chemotaxis protein